MNIVHKAYLMVRVDVRRQYKYAQRAADRKAYIFWLNRQNGIFSQNKQFSLPVYQLLNMNAGVD